MWDIDIMDVQANYLDGKIYTKVFSNGKYFAEIYPMANKADAGQNVTWCPLETGGMWIKRSKQSMD